MGRRSKKRRGFPFVLVILPTLMITAAGIGSTWLFSEDKTPPTAQQQIALGTIISNAPKALQEGAPSDKVDTNPAPNDETANTEAPTKTNTSESPSNKSSVQPSSQSTQSTPAKTENKPATQTDKKTTKSDLAQIQVPVPLPVDATKVENKAENIAGRDIAMEDFMSAGKIFMKKLTPNEISFLFGAANGRMLENNSVEELENIRRILLSKLTSQEVATINSIGKKYGRTMYILDPSVSIAERRAEHFKEKAAAQNSSN